MKRDAAMQRIGPENLSKVKAFELHDQLDRLFGEFYVCRPVLGGRFQSYR